MATIHTSLMFGFFSHSAHRGSGSGPGRFCQDAASAGLAFYICAVNEAFRGRNRVRTRLRYHWNIEGTIRANSCVTVDTVVVRPCTPHSSPGIYGWPEAPVNIGSRMHNECHSPGSSLCRSCPHRRRPEKHARDGSRLKQPGRTLAPRRKP